MIFDIVKEYFSNFQVRKFYKSRDLSYTILIETKIKVVLAGTLYA